MHREKTRNTLQLPSGNRPRSVLHRDFLTPEELISVLRLARAQRTRDWCMILLTYRHGLRSAEICALKLADVRNRSLSVQRVQGSLKTVQPLERHPSEPLLDEVVALRKWLAERPDCGSDFLFTSRKRGALHPSQFFRIFQAIAKEAGLPAQNRHPRVLKYSLAAHLLARNVDVVLVNHVLGYRSINSTLKLVTTTDQQAAAAVQGAIRETF